MGSKKQKNKEQKERINELERIVQKYEKNEDAALVLLKILLTYEDFDNISTAATLISMLLSRDVDYDTTAETSLFLNDCVETYVKNALKVEKLKFWQCQVYLKCNYKTCKVAF